MREILIKPDIQCQCLFMLSSRRGETHIVRHENITNQISSRFMTQTAKLFPVKLHLQMLFLCTVLPYWRHIDNFWGPCRLMLRIESWQTFRRIALNVLKVNHAWIPREFPRRSHWKVLQWEHSTWVLPMKTQPVKKLLPRPKTDK